MTRALALLFTLLTGFSLLASEFRISLLNDDKVLNDTASLLLTNGCSTESVEAFKKAVHTYKTDLFDTSKLPPTVAGFYTFQNLAEFNQAIPDPFCFDVRDKFTTEFETKGTPITDLYHYSLNCLDLVVLLTKDTGAKAPKLRNDFAGKCFAQFEWVDTTNRSGYLISTVKNPDDRQLLYPTNCYTWLTGLTRTSNELDFALSLVGDRFLPGKFENTDKSIKTFFADWNRLRKKDGLKFPRKIKIVSCGFIPVGTFTRAIPNSSNRPSGSDHRRYWEIEHVGIYLKHGDKLIYLEKNGPCGIYLRADFNNESELGKFIANKLFPLNNPSPFYEGAPIYVAVNDRLIHIARR